MFAQLAPELRDMGWGSLIPLHNPGKRPAVSRWQQWNATVPSDQQIGEWSLQYPGAGIGLAIGPDGVVAIDQDLTDPIASTRAYDIAFQTLGETPLEQVGQPPKRKLYYRRGPDFALSGRSFGGHEIYWTSGQVVLFSVHPDTGRPYWWPFDSPLTMSPVDLPVITGDAAMEYLSAMETAAPETERLTVSATGMRNTPARARAGIRFKTGTSDRSHGWASAMLVLFGEDKLASPLDIARATVIGAPAGSRHYTMTGSVIALAMLGHTDAEITDAAISPYADRFDIRERVARTRAACSALEWARNRIGPDDEHISTAIDTSCFEGAWNRRWGR